MTEEPVDGEDEEKDLADGRTGSETREERSFLATSGESITDDLHNGKLESVVDTEAEANEGAPAEAMMFESVAPSSELLELEANEMLSLYQFVSVRTII